MALLWIDGFDAYGSTPGNAAVGLYRYTVSGNTGLLVQNGRSGGYALQMAGVSRSIKTPTLGNLATVVVGFAFQPKTSYAAVVIMTLLDDATAGFVLRHTATGEFELRSGATVLGTTSGAAVALDTWAYIELKVTTHATTGAFELRINGTNVLSGSNVDTKNGTHDYINSVRLELSTGGTNLYLFDDFYICDTSGSVNNNFLGNRKVVTLFPNAEGDESDFTPASGTDNSAMVDDNPPPATGSNVTSDTDYVESSTVGHKDLYQYGNLGGSGSINGVQVTTICGVTDANTFTLKTLAKSGTTESADGGVTVSSTTYTAVSRILETNPDTSSAWTASEVDSAQFGIEVG